ncbi:unnamed protein product [Closterium sp. Naga37s-1]|nr:unnamed protein product [Closterium sp. Naga37s-1]
MRIGGVTDSVYNEYIAALGDEMKGMSDEFKALGLATNNVQVHTGGGHSAHKRRRAGGQRDICEGFSSREVFTEFVETVNGVHFSRDRNTLILTIHEAHRIIGEVARPVTEHGFSVQHLTNTRIVNIRGSVPEGGLPHLQGVEDALKGHYPRYADEACDSGEALLIEKFKMKPACYMTAAEFVNCDAGLCVEQGFRATPAASASDDSSGEMSLPDGPLTA